MSSEFKRNDGRTFKQVRPLNITYNIAGNADASVLFELGNTKVLCTVMLQDGVPSFLRNSGTGWLTAEYTMLPAATLQRIQRESSTMKKNGRSIEISRLIGRSIRSIVDLKLLGERTIYIDCDVIQADGGTRTAAITGAYCALHAAVTQWMSTKKTKAILLDTIGALSVGLLNNTLLLDINYKEDSAIDADVNFVMTGSGKIIEIQGATESTPFEWSYIEQMRVLAQEGIAHMLSQLCVDTVPEQPQKQQGFSIQMSGLQKFKEKVS